MQQAELEKKLSQKMLTRRLIECGIAIVFIVLAIVFHRLWQADSTYAFHLSWSMALSIVMPFMLLSDLIFCKYRTFEKAGRSVTVFRGMVYYIVYVGGREIQRIPLNGYTHFIEVWITAEVRATINFTRTIGCIAHISFSDHSPSIEI